MSIHVKENKYLEMMWNKVFTAYFKYYLGLCIEELKKITINFKIRGEQT
jgi:hypothetical protein